MDCVSAAKPEIVDLSELFEQVKPGHCLPQAFYTDEAVHREDLRRVYMRNWLFVGHEIQIPKPGDFFTFKIGDESIILTRAKVGAVHGLFNVCRHRGSAICNKESGHTNKLVCPYHQWVFDQDGSLLSARQMPENFDRSRYGLKKVHVRLLEGLIFVHFGAEPGDFGPMQRDLGEFLKPHGLMKSKICAIRNYDVQSNWKLIVENSRECYHCHYSHPEYAALMMSRPGDKAHAQQCEVLGADRHAHYAKLGLRTKAAKGPNYHFSRYPTMIPGSVSETESGQLAAPIMGSFTDPDAGVLGGFYFPNFMIEASSDYVVTFRFTPVSARRCHIQAIWFVREDAVEGRDYDVDKVLWFWRMTGEQDWKLCEDNQAGVNSSAYEPGPYAPDEIGGPTWLVEWYLDQLKR
jgi:Rieske 2Fe-2S family protein